MLAAKRSGAVGRPDRADAGRSGIGAQGVHPLGPGLGEGTAGDGRRAGMHANELVAAAVARKSIEAGRPHASARADGGHPAIVGKLRLGANEDHRRTAVALPRPRRTRSTLPPTNQELGAYRCQPSKPKSAWFDEASHTPIIAEKARRAESFIAAMADGRIDESEIKAQEKRLVQLMQKIEPQLAARSARPRSPSCCAN